VKKIIESLFEVFIPSDEDQKLKIPFSLKSAYIILVVCTLILWLLSL
jgi:hypothetical protein|tara:strand:+ start:2972 stop:3112 length:141 start_codon:yes stop_codon:yes gene_type:complete